MAAVPITTWKGRSLKGHGGGGVPEWAEKPMMGRKGGGSHGTAIAIKKRGGGMGGSLPGGGALPSVPGFEPLKIEAKPSPDLKRLQAEWEERKADLAAAKAKNDANLQYHIDQYKKRLGEGPTQRAIERSASAIRDQLSGLMDQAATAGAATGRGPGFGAGGLAESAQRAQAGAAADISLGRERDLDRLVLGGGGIMGAPGQREMGYSALQNQLFGMAPHEAAARFGLAEKDLGLRSYLGQLGAQTDIARAQADIYGRPIDWFRTLYGGGGFFS